MKIDRIKTYVIMAGWRPWAFLELGCDNGLVVHVDCTDAHGSLPGVISTIDNFKDLILGKDPNRIEQIYEDLYRISRQSAGGVVQKAIAAIENGLLGLKAKYLDIPVYSLLGGPVRKGVDIYWSHCGTTRVRSHEFLKGKKQVQCLDDIQSLAREVVDNGFHGLKTNLIIFSEDGKSPTVMSQGFRGGEGSYDLNLDKRRINSICRLVGAFRKGIGDDFDLILDVNMHFRADGLVKLAKELSQFGLTWLEVDLDDPQQLRFLRRKTMIPIASCEKRQLMSGYKPFFDAYSLDIAIVDVRWTGVWQAKKVADLAKCYEINVAVHNHGSPLATLMAAHFCAGVTNLKAMEYDVDDVPWREELITEETVIKNGQLILPARAGWGADLNMKTVKEHSV